MHFTDNLIRGTVTPMVPAMPADRPMYGYEKAYVRLPERERV